MILTRRKFFTLFAPAVVAACNIMPVRALAMLDDPLVNGIRYQDWLPDDELLSSVYWNGSITCAVRKPQSHFMAQLIAEHGKLIHWEPIIYPIEHDV